MVIPTRLQLLTRPDVTLYCWRDGKIQEPTVVGRTGARFRRCVQHNGNGKIIYMSERGFWDDCVEIQETHISGEETRIKQDTDCLVPIPTGENSFWMHVKCER